ncbi:hypothetical protein FQN57_003306 [Myotisia sp. PD_48]|nr:hypothetical protein FQN57_003306 [Myotisia sp. PD_48]
MSAQAPTTPKGPRNTRRNAKGITTPLSKPTINNTPVIDRCKSAIHAGLTADGDMNSTYDSGNTQSEGGLRPKKARPNKKQLPHNNTPTGNSVHRHTASQPAMKSPLAQRDSPCYAGPTFHASPAPSALPMPSFFSKSVPEAEYLEVDGSNSDSPETDPEQLTLTPTKARTLPAREHIHQGTSSPLDFLFKAARESKTPGQVNELEDRSSRISPPLNVAMLSPSSEGPPGGMFPLELEGSDSNKSQPPSNKPSITSSYREKMNALRAQNMASNRAGQKSPERHQNVNQSNALKNLLFNPIPQRAASASPKLRDQQDNRHLPLRNASDPPQAHRNGNNSSTNGTRVVAKDSIPHQYLAAVCNGTNKQRAPSSNLRTILSPTSPSTPPRNSSHVIPQVSTAPHQTSNGFTPGPINRVAPQFYPSSPSPKGFQTRTTVVETRRMEDDLRRILKIGNRAPSELGQTIA